MEKIKIQPPKRNKTGKGTPPPLNETNNNLKKVSDDTWVTLNFRVSPEFRKEFKQCALDKDLSMNQLLKELFNHVDLVK